MSDAGTRRLSAAWLVPMAVLFVVGWIIVDAYRSRGVEVVVGFPDGHGLGRGDMVRCRGIDVGTVTTVQLLGEGVEVTLELAPDSASRLARKGARWWISRPELDWSRVTGLDSLVGPRFIQVDPPSEVGADSIEVLSFDGLPAAPIVDRLSSGDLFITLKAVTRGSLHPGASVLYRGVEIGTILSAALADDAKDTLHQRVGAVQRTHHRLSWDRDHLERRLGAHRRLALVAVHGGDLAEDLPNAQLRNRLAAQVLHGVLARTPALAVIRLADEHLCGTHGAHGTQ